MEYMGIIIFVVGIFAIFYILTKSSTKELARGKKLQSKVSEQEITKWNKVLKSIPELNSKRKNAKASLILIPILVVITYIITKELEYEKGIVICFGVIVVLLIIFVVLRREYNRKYKNIVIKQAIKEYDSSLLYTANSGIDAKEYRQARFEFYDRFSSEDLVEGKIGNTNFKMSDVHTERRHHDKDGRTYYSTIFRGVFSIATLNRGINNEISIVNNTLKIGRRDSYITIDNEAFEQQYDVFTSDKILAMRILTPDVTTKLLDLQNEYYVTTEVKIKDNIIYFRFYVEDMFESHMFNRKKEATSICEYMLILNNLKTIISEIAKIIEGIDI